MQIVVSKIGVLRLDYLWTIGIVIVAFLLVSVEALNSNADKSSYHYQYHRADKNRLETRKFAEKEEEQQHISSNMSGIEEKKDCGGVAARLARPNILSLKPYRCARDDYDSGILLDANENAIGPTSLPTKSQDENHLVLERYPCPYQIPLKESYAKHRGYGLKPANIFVGVGSDEAIDLLIRIFCKPGDENILTTPPTYGMYKVCANVNDVDIINVPLTPDFDLQIPEVRRIGNHVFIFVLDTV